MEIRSVFWQSERNADGTAQTSGLRDVQGDDVMHL